MFKVVNKPLKSLTLIKISFILSLANKNIRLTIKCQIKNKKI